LKKISQSTTPIEVGLDEYFKNAVPILSENNVEIICKEIDESYDYFIEYGLGSSTLFFINKFKKYNLTLISVENSFNWFTTVVKYLNKLFCVIDFVKEVSYYKMKEIIKFSKQLNIENLAIPQKFSRRMDWKANLLLGRFKKFNPRSNSKYRGIIPFWRYAKYILIGIRLITLAFNPKIRPTRSLCKGRIKNIFFIFRNVPPEMKDQYGESPSREEYIEAGLIEIREALQKQKIVKSCFFIDGGPRAVITRTILEMEKEYPNFYPTIFLCEAYRAFYNEVTVQRLSGKYLIGSNLTINGQEVYSEPKKLMDKDYAKLWFGNENITKEELAQKEVWFYKKSEI